jgi:phospho-N-acetylmuramoyl-pentapeptide-transferase
MLDYIDIIRIIGISFIIALLLGPLSIPLLRKLNVGQSIREEGPKSHIKKSGTPTMGGIIFLLAAIVTSLTSGIVNKDISLLIFSTLGFGAIGFIDDFIKVVLKRNLGLRAYQKLLAQILIAVILVIYQTKTASQGTEIIVPFLNNFYLDLGILYLPFIIFVVVGTVNSVNLTDGLDGLLQELH